jgi:hypothetical protein
VWTVDALTVEEESRNFGAEKVKSEKATRKATVAVA